MMSMCYASILNFVKFSECGCCWRVSRERDIERYRARVSSNGEEYQVSSIEYDRSRNLGIADLRQI